MQMGKKLVLTTNAILGGPLPSPRLSPPPTLPDSQQQQEAGSAPHPVLQTWKPNQRPWLQGGAVTVGVALLSPQTPGPPPQAPSTRRGFIRGFPLI